MLCYNCLNVIVMSIKVYIFEQKSICRINLFVYPDAYTLRLVQIAVYQQVPVGLIGKAPDQRAGDRGFESFTGGIPCLFFSKVSVVFTFNIVFLSNV